MSATFYSEPTISGVFVCNYFPYWTVLQKLAKPVFPIELDK